MIYNPNNELDCKNAIEKLKHFISKGQKFELKAKFPKRTILQNNYLHLLIDVFAIETGYTRKEVKDILKKIINPDIFYIEKTSDSFNELIEEKWKSTASLTTQEINLVISRFKNFSAKEVGIYLPDSKNLELLEQIEEEIKKHKYQEFI